MFLPVLTVLGQSALAVPACVDPDVILHEQYSGITSPRVELLEDEAAFCAAWDEVYSIRWPVPVCDTSRIDFTTQSAVLVGIGTRSNGCYDVRVACTLRGGADRVGLGVLEYSPGPGCICTQALVQPVEIVVVDKPVASLELKRRVKALDCAF